MKFKKIIAAIMILLMLLSLFTGCKSNVPDEEEAVTDSIVEGEEQEMTGNGPQKVEGNDQQADANEDQQADANEDQKNEDQQETPKDDQQETPEDDQQQNADQDQQGNEETEEPSNDGNEEEKPQIQYDPLNKIKVVDYNIRCANDGINSVTGSDNDIKARAPRFLALIEKYDPDIIGLQEAVPEWIKYLENGIDNHDALIHEYELRYKYRAESNKECTPILWKKDKFEALDEGYYWLSETPDIESKGWGASLCRICNWVRLKVKATGKIFVFVNTHLQGGNPAVQSASLIAQRTRQIGGFSKYPVILTGDFNYAPWSDGYNAFLAKGFVDINDYLGFNKDYTNNGYNERPDDSSENSIKDYIMYASDKEGVIEPLLYYILNEKYYEGWISDHRGLYGEFAIL